MLLYGAFLNNPAIGKKKNMDEFASLYIRTIKASFGIGKRQCNSESLKQLDLPTPEQAIDMGMIGVLHRWDRYYGGEGIGDLS